MEGIIRIETTLRENALKQKKRKAGLKFNPGLTLIDLRAIDHYRKYHNIHMGVKMVPRENENNAYANFGVTKKEHSGMLCYFL